MAEIFSIVVGAVADAATVSVDFVWYAFLLRHREIKKKTSLIYL